MQIIKLDLSHDNFFCPVTGHHITSPEHYTPSPATLGMWHFEILEDADVYDDALRLAWDNYWDALGDDDLPDVEAFLSIDQAPMNNPNYVCFEILTTQMACGPIPQLMWFVIDMDYNLDEKK